MSAKAQGYFKNSLLIRRECDVEKKGLVEKVKSGDVVCRLNGYAVIPMDLYKELTSDKG